MKVAWILIGIIILVVVIVLKIASKKQELVVRFVIILFVFIMLTVGYVYVQTNSEIRDPKEAIDFSKAYLVWLSKVFINTKEISGYIGKQSWEVENNNTMNLLNQKI
ncbi:MAG TPA: hypothetical protein VJ208_01755 [Candidatus Nanoarchaeia archaeon]|nr:hypothetical protein [Candidatus Nanoarchaeia archaeon]